MPEMFSEIPPFNGGSLLLVWTVVVGSGGVDVYFWAGEDFEMLLLSFFIYAKIWLSDSASSVIFSVVSLWFLSDSFLLASMVASMTRNWSPDLVSILLPPFGILKLEVGRVVIYGADGRSCANNLVKSVCSARDSG